MKNNIVIVGDSWAAGVPVVHDDGQLDLVYGGMTKFLVEYGYQVINLGRKGASNLQACDRLNDYLLFNDPAQIAQIKMVLFWNTEFFREIWYYNQSQLEKELAHHYPQLRDHWIYRPYHRLADISQRWNIPVYIIGGFSDTVWYDEFEKDFPGVHIACQSATNLLINGQHRIETPVHCVYLNGWVDPFLDLIKPRTKGPDLEALIDDIELGHQRALLFEQHREPLFPDRTHPNETAQKTLFDWLMHRVPGLDLRG